MCVAQAKTRFHTYPSPAASHWVHAHYTQLGGKFVESTKQLTRHEDRDRKEQHEKEEKEKAKH
jgi:hypothetical protein